MRAPARMMCPRRQDGARALFLKGHYTYTRRYMRVHAIALTAGYAPTLGYRPRAAPLARALQGDISEQTLAANVMQIMRVVGLAWVCNSAGSHCVIQDSQRHSIAGISIRAFDIYPVLGLVGGVFLNWLLSARACAS